MLAVISFTINVSLSTLEFKFSVVSERVEYHIEKFHFLTITILFPSSFYLDSK